MAIVNSSVGNNINSDNNGQSAIGLDDSQNDYEIPEQTSNLKYLLRKIILS